MRSQSTCKQCTPRESPRCVHLVYVFLIGVQYVQCSFAERQRSVRTMEAAYGRALRGGASAFLIGKETCIVLQKS